MAAHPVIVVSGRHARCESVAKLLQRKQRKSPHPGKNSRWLHWPRGHEGDDDVQLGGGLLVVRRPLTPGDGKLAVVSRPAPHRATVSTSPHVTTTTTTTTTTPPHHPAAATPIPPPHHTTLPLPHHHYHYHLSYGHVPQSAPQRCVRHTRPTWGRGAGAVVGAVGTHGTRAQCVMRGKRPRPPPTRVVRVSLTQAGPGHTTACLCWARR